MKTLAIIGGGAAGLAAAVAAGETARAAGAAFRVVVYEASDRVGRTILATGNGRCNFSNAAIDAAVYRNDAFVEEALARLEKICAKAGGRKGAGESTGASNAVLGFFADRGLLWREEGEGRLYPLANKATSVLDCLRAACAAVGVEEQLESEVTAVEPPRSAEGLFTLRLRDKRIEHAHGVIVAAGGTLLREVLSVGVPWEAPVPVLGPLACDSPWPRQLDNIRVRGALELWRSTKKAPDGKAYQERLEGLGHRPDAHGAEQLVARERGEVMFRKYGVSGIAAFNLSRLANPSDELAVDFLPDVPADEAEAFLNRRRKILRATLDRAVTADDLLRGMVLAPVADVLLKAAGLSGASEFGKGDTARLVPVLKGLRLPVTGIGDVRQCQVHRGGVKVSAVNPRTCELADFPGLFVVGEALDVDAPCGGYNLHWAWASGLLAGASAVEALGASERPEPREALA